MVTKTPSDSVIDQLIAERCPGWDKLTPAMRDAVTLAASGELQPLYDQCKAVIRVLTRLQVCHNLDIDKWAKSMFAHYKTTLKILEAYRSLSEDYHIPIGINAERVSNGQQKVTRRAHKANTRKDRNRTNRKATSKTS